MKHNHDVLMAINSRIINGRSSGAKQLNADYRALVKARDEILKLRAALAGQPEPVKTYSGGKAWHVAPTQPLTDEQIDELARFHGLEWMIYEPFARAIEAAHGITKDQK